MNQLSDEAKAKIAEHAKNAPMPGTTARPLVEGQPLHVDGDYLAYYCAGNDDTSVGEARNNALSRLARGAEVSGSSRIIVHLSARDCDKGKRHAVAKSKPYQGQRDSGRKPKNWDSLREWMEDYDGDRFTVKVWRDREADDGMAYVSEASYRINRPGAVMTADKDMRMFAGLHIVWKTYEMVEIPQGTYEKWHGGKCYGHKWFWLQMIQGDTADNIPGLPRCGEVAALKTLEGTTCNQQAMEKVLDLYRSKMGDDYSDYFVEQAVLLWMRTDIGAKLCDFLTIPGVEWPADVRRAANRLMERVP